MTPFAPARLAVLVLALVLLGLAGLYARSAWRIYQVESACYRPARRTPALGAALLAQGGLRTVTFASADGTTLRGSFLPPRRRPGPVIVFAHGSLGDRAQLAEQAAALARRGFGALLFDWPGHGESAGRVTLGSAEQAALQGALRYAAAQPESDARGVGAFGCSMGAFLLLVAAPDLPELRALAVESAPTNLLDVTRFQYRHRAPLGPWMARLAAWRAGVNLAAAGDAEARIAGLSPRPVLIVHDAADGALPPAMAARLYAAAREPRTLWTVPDAEHCGAYARDPEGFGERVGRFFEQALR
jgi:alpha-beta hydrolase superfamily lysophospholipase